MTVTTERKPASQTVQDVCIDLPGETVQCWRSSDKVKVVLRKHRDVIFDIHLQAGASYSVESRGAFYCPVLKKLTRKVEFSDGNLCHVWVGREFKDALTLKRGSRVLGIYQVNTLDKTAYGGDPKTKPEPLMVVMGQKNPPASFVCTPEDPFGVGSAHPALLSTFEPKLSILKDTGTKFDYTFLHQSPDVREYVAITEAGVDEIQPHVIAQLESGAAVTGTVKQIFIAPKDGQRSLLYTAILRTAGYVSGSETLTGNAFKETAGYFAENFRRLNEVAMTVHIEKKVKGKYRVALKGYLISDVFGKITGGVHKLKPKHVNVPLGSERSAFIDGGFAKSGRAGYGGFKRIMLSSAENFGKGMKIQVIGTVIDLIVDANTVYFDEKGSKDLSEFLGRAGVSIVKAGVSAAIGSVFAAAATAGLSMLVAGAVPLAIIALIVVVGFIGAATLVDAIDDGLNIKEGVAKWAR